MKLTKEQLKRIAKEEHEKVKDTTGFFSGPGFDKTKEEDERRAKCGIYATSPSGKRLN